MYLLKKQSDNIDQLNSEGKRKKKNKTKQREASPHDFLLQVMTQK